MNLTYLTSTEILSIGQSAKAGSRLQKRCRNEIKKRRREEAELRGCAENGKVYRNTTAALCLRQIELFPHLW